MMWFTQFWKVISRAQPPHIHSTYKDVFSQNVISLITWDTSVHYYIHCFSGKTGFGLHNVHFLQNVREQCFQFSHTSAVWFYDILQCRQVLICMSFVMFPTEMVAAWWSFGMWKTQQMLTTLRYVHSSLFVVLPHSIACLLTKHM